MGRRRLTGVAIAIVAAVVTMAGCSRSDSIESTTPESTVAPTTIVETTTTLEPTTTLETTSTTTEATSTTEATTTTTAATTTVAPTTSEAPTPPPDAPATAFVIANEELIELDVASGEPVRTVVEFFNGDGVFRGDLRLSPDAASIWFSEGYVDGWYGCDSSVGSVGRVDLATGGIEVVGVGFGIEPSPDGTAVVYVSSDLCLPDPENPELWVLTPYDRVVVRELETGTERVVVTDVAPENYTSPSQVEWAGYTSDGRLLVLTTDGALRAIDLEGSGVIQEHPVLLSAVRGIPFGASADSLYTIDRGEEGSADVYRVDLASGDATLLATSESYLVAGLATSGAIAVSGFGDVTVEPGAPVALLTPPADVTYYDLDW